MQDDGKPLYVLRVLHFTCMCICIHAIPFRKNLFWPQGLFFVVYKLVNMPF